MVFVVTIFKFEVVSVFDGCKFVDTSDSLTIWQDLGAIIVVEAAVELIPPPLMLSSNSFSLLLSCNGSLSSSNLLLIRIINIISVFSGVVLTILGLIFSLYEFVDASNMRAISEISLAIIIVKKSIIWIEFSAEFSLLVSFLGRCGFGSHLCRNDLIVDIGLNFGSLKFVGFGLGFLEGIVVIFLSNLSLINTMVRSHLLVFQKMWLSMLLLLLIALFLLLRFFILLALLGIKN